ncbi:hypothetical protein [Oceanicella actignis]|uniref:Uncharacterized protein n=1 Tax=Oceanicella actignis TaxID=1189325 RepID=A0A1M7TH05_9RHOB|nr:hypothetical protein [Oceanicella actignis]TYO88489.1 hypothetical protein LY05_02149 [Oceanicella actignis]SET59768.1 hypothetical protein SAMN04488119_10671 [Oceanicella actignis]SHN69898.1 hypothetical protein SAMN05216200_106132 [Oceanicella actignis]
MTPRRLRQMLEGAACVLAPVLAAQGAATLSARAGGGLVSQAAIFLVVAQGTWALTLSGFMARWAPDPRQGRRAAARFLSGGARAWAMAAFALMLAAAAAGLFGGGFATGVGRAALGAAALSGMALVGILLNLAEGDEERRQADETEREA